MDTAFSGLLLFVTLRASGCYCTRDENSVKFLAIRLVCATRKLNSNHDVGVLEKSGPYHEL